MSSLSNLLLPAVLFFALGFIARVIKSDLRFPPDLAKILSIYLLMAIGLHGGYELAKADLMCVAPASANFLAKTAGGIADDLVTTLYLAMPNPILVCPAMNCEMWAKPAVQRNLAQLRSDGVHFIDPEDGWLSCRQRGVGRMADADTIFEGIVNLLESS